MSGTWIQTYTRRRFDLAKPDYEVICLEDVAHALSRLCRFAGHIGPFYSVAQHSVIVAKLVVENLAMPYLGLHALLHDASEAYTGDMTRPFKAALGPKARTIEAAIQKAIWQSFGLIPPTEKEWRFIHAADNVALQTEVRDLMGGAREDWECDWPEVFEHEVMDRVIVPLLPEEAEAQFMASFRNLTRVAK